MVDQTFLVPANSKRSGLIWGFFKPLDLVIFVIGISLTFALLMLTSVNDIKSVVIIMLPVCMAGFLIFPIPNYHNVRTFLIDLFNYFRNRRKYIWRGWCYKYEQRD